MYKEHPVFEKPKDKNANIWRYMDFTKFVDLLDKSALFFPRADKLGDPFEGLFPKSNVKLRPEMYKGEIPQHVFKQLGEFLKWIRKSTVINSWHLSEYESAAMWRLYLKSNEGIAIQSSYSRLRDSIKGENNDVYIGKVKYIDYEKDWMPESNLFYPFIYKRKSFEHEKELRALIQKIPRKKDGDVNFNKDSFSDGLYVVSDLDTLIDQIYVAPTCQDWLFELVKSITNKYGYKKKVRRSSLDEVPVF